MSHFLSYKGDSWEYEVFGNGSRTLLAFHGFGASAADYRVFEPSLGRKYTIYSFSLPYHGNSTLGEQHKKTGYSTTELKHLFAKFIEEKSIKSFSLMGYSLGGKIALKMIELFPGRISTVYLLAPDGIKTNWENSFVTKTGIGKKIYMRIIEDPSGLYKIMKVLKAMKVITPKIEEFIHNQLSTREKRQLVWDLWMCFRGIKPHISHVQYLINKRKIIVHLYFGKYDAIIPPSVGKSFASGLKTNGNKKGLHIIEASHNLIREKMNDHLAKTL